MQQRSGLGGRGGACEWQCRGSSGLVGALEKLTSLGRRESGCGAAEEGENLQEMRRREFLDPVVEHGPE